MFTGMEAQALAEKRDMVSGLILLKISISIVFFGLRIRSCKILIFLFLVTYAVFVHSLFFT